MRGLIEMAIEREADRLDEIMESADSLDVPFFAPRHFRTRVHPQRKSSRGGLSYRFSPRQVSASHYAN